MIYRVHNAQSTDGALFGEFLGYISVCYIPDQALGQYADVHNILRKIRRANISNPSIDTLEHPRLTIGYQNATNGALPLIVSAGVRRARIFYLYPVDPLVIEPPKVDMICQPLLNSQTLQNGQTITYFTTATNTTNFTVPQWYIDNYTFNR